MRRLSLEGRRRPVGRSVAFEKPDLSPAEMEDLVTILFAGQAASRRLSRAPSRVAKPLTRDERKAARLLARLGDPRAGRRLRRRAQRLVSRHWKDIEVVARALLQRYALEVEEAHALLEGEPRAVERRMGRRST